MLKEKQTKRRVKEPSNNDGAFDEIKGLLTQVVQTQKDQAAQLEELTKNQDAGGRAKLLATDIAYNPDEAHLSDMAVIVPRAVEPFALARTLAGVLDDEVRSGKRSLTQIYISEVKHLSRGLKGKGFDLAAQHAREAEGTKPEESVYEQTQLGKGL
jgi:hypothetical protein